MRLKKEHAHQRGKRGAAGVALLAAHLIWHLLVAHYLWEAAMLVVTQRGRALQRGVGVAREVRLGEGGEVVPRQGGRGKPN